MGIAFLGYRKGCADLHGGRGVHGGNGFWDYPYIDLKDPALLELVENETGALADACSRPR